MHATSCRARLWKLQRELARRLQDRRRRHYRNSSITSTAVGDLKLGVGKDAHAVVKAADVIKG